jgi:cytochrome P450
MDLTVNEKGQREVRGHHAVREAAKDWRTYSSDLTEDRDVRIYKQLPLELDPPRHTKFREAVQPLFMSAALEPKADSFEVLAARLISESPSAAATSRPSWPFYIRDRLPDHRLQPSTGLPGRA